MSEGQLEAYKDIGIEHYQFVAALGERTCDTCGGLDGEVFSVAEAMEGDNYPPMHANCRCTTIMADADLSSRIARDPLTGENYKVDGDMTFGEWKDSLTPEQRAAMEKYVDNSGESGIIKSITVDDIQGLYGNGAISDEIIREIENSFGGNQKFFDHIDIVSIPKHKNGTIDVFRTNVTPKANWTDVTFEINKEFFRGKSLQDVNAIILENHRKGHFVSENIKDLIEHEAGHAKAMYGKNYAHCKAITNELSDIHIEGISRVASMNGDECIAECNVLLSKNKTIPQEAQDLVNKYWE